MARLPEIPNMPDDVFEKCLRALYGAPDDRPSLTLLLSMTDDPKALRLALSVAYEAGRLAHVPWNPLEVQAVNLDEVNP